MNEPESSLKSGEPIVSPFRVVVPEVKDLERTVASHDVGEEVSLSSGPKRLPPQDVLVIGRFRRPWFLHERVAKRCATSGVANPLRRGGFESTTAGTEEPKEDVDEDEVSLGMRPPLAFFACVFSCVFFFFFFRMFGFGFLSSHS